MMFWGKRVAIVVNLIFLILIGNFSFGCIHTWGAEDKPPRFGEHAVKINGHFISPEIFTEEQNRFFLRWRRNSEMLHKSDEERTNLLLEDILNRVVLEEYLYRQSKVNIKTTDVNDYINRYIKTRYSTPAEMDTFMIKSNYQNENDLKKGVEFYLRKLECFSKIALHYGLTIPPEELKQEYQKHVNDSVTVVARHILVTDPDPLQAKLRATDIYQQLKQGKDFTEMAARYSGDELTKSKGGLMDPLPRAEALPEIEKNIFNVKPGEVVPPFQTKNGYEVVLVEKYIPYYHPQAEFEKMLIIERFGKTDFYKKWLLGIRAKQKIEILDPALKAYRLYRGKQYTRAGVCYEKAYGVYHLQQYLHRAVESYQEGKNWQQVIRVGRQGMKEFKNVVPFYLSVAEGLHQTGKEKSCRELLNQAETIAADNLYYRSLIIQTYTNLGMKEDAARVREKKD